MTTSTRQLDGVTIVDLSGRITLEEGSAALRETIKQLIGQGQKRVLLNMSNQTQTFRVESAAQERLLSTYLDGAGGAKSEDVLLRANEGLILRETSDAT